MILSRRFRPKGKEKKVKGGCTPRDRAAESCPWWGWAKTLVFKHHSIFVLVSEEECPVITETCAQYHETSIMKLDQKSKVKRN
jgi:hypothetical protein